MAKKTEKLAQACYQRAIVKINQELTQRFGSPEKLGEKASAKFREYIHQNGLGKISANNKGLDKIINALDNASQKEASQLEKKYFDIYEKYYGKELRKVNEEVYGKIFKETAAEIANEKKTPELEFLIIKQLLKRAAKDIKKEYRLTGLPGPAS